MPKFYFHIEDASEVVDDLGMELPGLAEAKCEAVRYAGSLICDHASKFWNSGAPTGGHRIASYSSIFFPPDRLGDNAERRPLFLYLNQLLVEVRQLFAPSLGRQRPEPMESGR